jgi:hypothetical protein
VGTDVEVRNRFTGNWSVGFEMVGRANGLFHVRRLRDGAILPIGFRHDEIRICAPPTERVDRVYVVMPDERLSAPRAGSDDHG